MDRGLERECGFIDQRLGFYLGRVVRTPLNPPDHVYFSLTNRCNLRCRMCDVSRNPSTSDEELSTAEVKDIVLQVKALGIKHLIFSGGEPLLRQDIMEILDFSVSKNIGMVDMITNGVLLDDAVIQALIKMKLNHITVSLDGLREVNDGIRGGGVFAKAAENIDLLNHYKARAGSAFPTIGVNFTIMDPNIDDILPMVEFARNKRSNAILFQPLLRDNTKMYEKKKNPLWPCRGSIGKLRKIMEKVAELKENIPDLYICSEKELLRALPDHFLGKKPPRGFQCYEAIKRIVITYNGKLWSCGGIYGDLRKSALKEAWFSDKAKEVRDKAAACRRHCLQDCVYIPSNIFEQIEVFLGKLPVPAGEDASEMIRRLRMKVREYSDIFRVRVTGKPGILTYFQRLRLKRELKSLSRINDRIAALLKEKI